MFCKQILHSSRLRIAKIALPGLVIPADQNIDSLDDGRPAGISLISRAATYRLATGNRGRKPIGVDADWYQSPMRPAPWMFG
jgi:hypothetical protein